MRDATRGRGRLDVEGLVECLQPVPHPDASTEDDRHLDQVHVVDQSCGDEFAHDRDSTADPHVLPVCGRPSLLERLAGCRVEEVVRRSEL